MKRAVTFYYDDDSGELSKISWGDDFKNESGLMQIDVLGDIKSVVVDTYENGVSSVFPKNEKNKDKAVKALNKSIKLEE